MYFSLLEIFLLLAAHDGNFLVTDIALLIHNVKAVLEKHNRLVIFLFYLHVRILIEVLTICKYIID